MQTLSLNGFWHLSQVGSDDSISATVPGCVHLDLKAAEVIPDPFYRDNEDRLQWIGEADWSYRREFTVTAELLAEVRVLLQCEGLDTFARLILNGTEIGQTENMFRTYEFEVKSLLTEGENSLEIVFTSTIPYVRERQAERFLWHTGIDHHRINGGNWVRKEQANYGWDWGPMLATAGIWRDLQLVGLSAGRLTEVATSQWHADDGSVSLSLAAQVEGVASGAQIVFTLSLEEAEIATETVALEGDSAATTFLIRDPELWWPNGLGAPTLYDLQVELRAADGTVIAFDAKRLGLRVLELVQERDEWGQSFHFRCNGRDFFGKGANWIPADQFDAAVTDEILRDLLQSAADAHMNMIRVWGGGLYERDEFYDLCDSLGLCVWQDFMFACSAYPAHDDNFLANVRVEAEQNVKRLRHHACIALWCGNNELEQIGGILGDKHGEMRWNDYAELFDKLLPEVLERLDPDRPYWPSSEHSPIGNRQGNGASTDPRWGDAHLWTVWHGREPFEWYRTSFHRFCSEFGFQSFPHPETVESYTEPGERNITSYVMERHQRSPIGNSAIIDYLLSWFRLPVGWKNTVWLSQILQGLAIKYAVEHWRRNMPRCMGAVYWQLNDCWPVASWSSLDHARRWKALHYESRRFFAPLLISGVEKPEARTLEVWLTSDEPTPREATVCIDVFTTAGDNLKSLTRTVTMPENGSVLLEDLDLASELAAETERGLLIKLRLVDGDTLLSENLVTFARPKHLDLRRPKLTVEKLSEEEYEGDTPVYVVTTDRPALWVWLEVEGDPEIRWTDNFFTVLPGERKRVSPQEGFGLDLELAQIRPHSLYDTYQES